MKLTFTAFYPSILRKLLAAVCLVVATTSVQAQEGCTYSINMFDTFGDGWNGGFLTLVSNGTATDITLDAGLSEGVATFDVVNGGTISATWTPGFFENEVSYEILDASGMVIFSSGTPPASGLVFSGVACCGSSCDGPPSSPIAINPITDSTAHLNWLDGGNSAYYILEYGPTGFPLGTGIQVQVMDSDTTLNGLNACIDYSAYIIAVCSSGIQSCPVGPVNFTTDCSIAPPAGGPCNITLELFSTTGFGWNNAQLTVDVMGTTDFYTLFFGETSATIELDVAANENVIISFIPGFDDTGISYNILDQNGTVIYESSTPLEQGPVASFIACAACERPLEISMKDVNADNATVQWTPFPGSEGSYLVEYGPVGFTLGTGTAATVPAGINSYKMTNLEEDTWYNVYVQHDCGDDTLSLPQNPLFFHTLRFNDIGVSAITAPDPSAQCNLGSDEEVTISITNFGQAPQTLFEFYYAVNGEVQPIPVPNDGLFTGVVGNDSTQTISFETTYDFSAPGVYIVEAWTVLDEDSNSSNDTARFEIITAFPQPVNEDFEDADLPLGWTSSGFIYAPFSHNNETYVLGENLYAFNTEFSLNSGRIGPVAAGDSIYFDYRYTNWPSGTTGTELSDNDNLQVQISTDCEVTFQTVLTIDNTNHVTSAEFATRALSLDDFAGEAIHIRFLATWGAGDYWLDIDNINVTGCPSTFGLDADIVGTEEGQATGSISLTPTFGTAPFTYDWMTGETTSSLDSLPAGSYSVTVQDANGCSETRTFNVGVLVSAGETEAVRLLSLYPNPTGGTAWLNAAFAEMMEVQVRLLNLNGQVIFQSEMARVESVRHELDLSAQPSGMYILQVIANGQPHYAKLMVTK